MFLIKKRSLIPFLLFFILTVFSILLILDFSFISKIQGERLVGSVDFIYNKVSRKTSKSVVWQELEKNSPLFDKDSILTDSKSLLLINLGKSINLEVQENTMFTIDASTERLGIDFYYGDFKINSESINIPLQINSPLGKGFLLLKNGIVHLRSIGKRIMEFTVQKGTAEFKTQTKNLTFTSGETGVFENELISKLNTGIKLLTPENLAIIAGTSKMQLIQFAWENQNPLVESILELSDSFTFEKVIYREKTESRNFTISLTEGIYYWRILNKANGRFSEIRSFYILPQRILKILKPSVGETLPIYGKQGSYFLEWTEDPLANYYTLEIAKNPNFNSSIFRKETDFTVSNFSFNEQGEYYVRVRSVINWNKRLSLLSEPLQFRIQNQDKIPELKIFQPVANEEILLKDIQKNQYYFIWKKHPGVEYYTIQISMDPEFTKNIYTANTKLSYILPSFNTTVGKYYWTLKGILKPGLKEKEIVSSSSFYLKDRMDIKVFYPTNFSKVNLYPDYLVSFKWENPAVMGKYKFMLYKQTDTKPYFEKILENANLYKHDIRETGEYRWKIIVLNEKNEILAESPMLNFFTYEKKLLPTINLQ